MATIRDVAKLANVSVSTVSLMLNGKKNISEEKYYRIIDAIEQLKYRPNYIAQNLKKQKARIVGVVLPEMDTFYGQIFHGINHIFDNEEFYVITKTSKNNVQNENRVLEELLDIGVSGMLVVPCEPENVEKYQRIADKGIPIVFIERKVNDTAFSNVLFDNKNLIYDTVYELLDELSAKDIMLIVGQAKYSSERDCVEGYLEAMERWHKEKGIELKKEHIRKFEVWLQKEYAFNTLFDHFYDMDDKPRCCITSNQQVARALREVFGILKHEARIITLAESDWMSVTKNSFGMERRSRETVKMGEKAAELLARFTKNSLLVENQTIVVHSNDDIGDKSEKIKKPISKKTLRVLLFESNAMDALVKLSKGFESHYNMRLEFNILPYLELKQEVKKQIEGKSSEYDIIMVDLPWANKVQNSGLLLDLKSKMAGDESILDSYPQGIKSAFFKTQRNIYGLPIIATTETLFYRSDIFEDKDIKWSFFKKYGFEINPPRTWTEFNYIAEFFNRSVNPNSPVEYGTAICGLNPIGIVEEFFPRQWAFNGKILDEWGKVDLDSDENVRALTSLEDTYKNSPKESLSWFFDDAFNKLLSGEIIMAQGFSSHYLPYKHSKLNDTFDRFIKVTTIPGGKPMLGCWILGINSYSDAQDEGYTYLRWATSNTLAVHNIMMGGAVPLKAVCDNTLLKTKFPWLRFIDETFSNMGTREVIRDSKGNLIDPDVTDPILADAIYRTLMGNETARESLIGAKKAFQQLVNN
ncbi:MAG: extracellular solute-binding protein [Christensenellales bacterium]